MNEARKEELLAVDKECKAYIFRSTLASKERTFGSSALLAELKGPPFQCPRYPTAGYSVTATALYETPIYYYH